MRDISQLPVLCRARYQMSFRLAAKAGIETGVAALPRDDEFIRVIALHWLGSCFLLLGPPCGQVTCAPNDRGAVESLIFSQVLWGEL